GPQCCPDPSHLTVRIVPRWWWHRHFVSTCATGWYFLDVPLHVPGTRNYSDVLHLERYSRWFYRAGASRIYRDRRPIAQLSNNNLRCTHGTALLEAGKKRRTQRS